MASAENQSPRLQKIFTDLGYIAMFQAGYKPNIYSRTQSPNTIWGSFSRTIHGENHVSMIFQLNQIITTAIDELNLAGTFREQLVFALNEAQQGLKNLLISYEGRPEVIPSLQTLINLIDHNLAKMG